jgi:hypothetical protein
LSARDTWPWLGLWRGVLLLAALDAAALGLIGGVRPALLFERLGVEPRHDTWAWQLLVPRGDSPGEIPAPRDAGLWQLLAFLSLAQAGFLALAGWRPRTFGGLAVAPLIGHALGAALWLWALGTISTFPENRVPFHAPGVLIALAVHDAVWLVISISVSSRSNKTHEYVAVAALIGKRLSGPNVLTTVLIPAPRAGSETGRLSGLSLPRPQRCAGSGGGARRRRQLLWRCAHWPSKKLRWARVGGRRRCTAGASTQ